MEQDNTNLYQTPESNPYSRMTQLKRMQDDGNSRLLFEEIKELPEFEDEDHEIVK